MITNYMYFLQQVGSFRVQVGFKSTEGFHGFGCSCLHAFSLLKKPEIKEPRCAEGVLTLRVSELRCRSIWIFLDFEFIGFGA